MDRKLVGWARAVKRRGRVLPPLWLVTDGARLPDVVAAAMRLPPRLAGVIFRNDAPGHDPVVRSRQAALLARLCRRRHLALSIAGAPGLAARWRTGLHIRGGRRGVGPRPAFITSSAHDRIELYRARRAGATLILLSPVFPTASHQGAPSLGVLRWGRLAGLNRTCAVALGGIDGRTVQRLPRWCRHVAAIGALI